MNVAHRPLVWDSEMLDLLTGTVEVADDATTRAADGEALAERILAAAPGDEVLTCIKLPASQPVALAALLRAGGTFIDSEQTFIHVHGVDVDADQTPGANLAAPQVQICTRYDGDAFADLVPDIVHSRFRRDPRIPAAHAEALWRASIRNHCDGRASTKPRRGSSPASTTRTAAGCSWWECARPSAAAVLVRTWSAPSSLRPGLGRSTSRPSPATALR